MVAALEPHFEDEDGAHLRRRCRRVLTRVSPDLLVQRARRARERCGLRRWVEEPGVDRWEGTFPSEDAARAWAAIDALAHRYVEQAVCPTIERARAQALTDLVAGNATVDAVITLTVPAAAVLEPAAGDPHQRPGDRALDETDPAAARVADLQAVRDAVDHVADGTADDLVEVTGPAAGQPVLVSRPWVASKVRGGRDGEGVGTGATVHIAQCHPVTGALLDTATDLAPRPSPQVAPTNPGVEGRHTDAANEEAQAEGEHGSNEGEITRGSEAIGGDKPQATVAAAERYRPSGRLARRVRARDRRCRFPGCSVAAVFCDLDHVRPWPGGPTTVGNLMCLCRRHHRVKQRPGWRVALASDGTATWTDPTGRIRSTEPVDALSVTVLRGADPPATAPDPSSTTSPTSTPSRARTVLPDGPHSTLEFLLEHQGAAPPAPSPTRAWRDERDRPGRRHRAELQPARGTLLVTDPDHWPHRRNGRNRRNPCGGDSDPPPF